MTDPRGPLTLAQLVALDVPAYTAAVKGRLRSDDAWIMLLHPAVVERTRQTLEHMVASMNRQMHEARHPTTEWTNSIIALKRFTQQRLNAMPAPVVVEIAVSNTKEARAWRAFSALLADALARKDWGALDKITTPYGGLTARQWALKREEVPR